MSTPGVQEGGNVHNASLNGEVQLTPSEAFIKQIKEINDAEKNKEDLIPSLCRLLILMDAATKNKTISDADLILGIRVLSLDVKSKIDTLLKEKKAASSALSSVPSGPSSTEPIRPSHLPVVNNSNSTSLAKRILKMLRTN